MLKGLLLTILGWFGKKADQATDLRYAGREHIRQVKNSIEEVRAQRNEVAGGGILLENEIADLERRVQHFADAVRHHDASGNTVNKDKAYRGYVAEEIKLNKARADLEENIVMVAELDEQIYILEQDTEEAKDSIQKAANQQMVGRAARKVEGVHKNLRSGPLSGAIEESKIGAATAEAARRSRKENDNSDVLAYRTEVGVMSMDDLLGKAEPTPTHGTAKNHIHGDDAAYANNIATTSKAPDSSPSSAADSSPSSSSSSSDSSSSSSSD